MTFRSNYKKKIFSFQIDVLNPSLDELDKNLSLTCKEAAKKVAAEANACSEATKNMIPK